MSFPTVLGNAPEGLLLCEPQSCLGPAFAGATYQFFLTGTTTPANVYQDGALTTPFPITGFVTADNFGRFPPIYLDTSIIYKVQFFDSSNTLRWTVDPYVATLSTVGSNGTAGQAITPTLFITSTGEVSISAPIAGGSGVTLTLTAGALGSVPLMVTASLAGQAAIIVNSSATTGIRTATFTATNKPGTATSSPAGWLPITCDGVTYYTPIWHGNNFTPYLSNPTALGEVIVAKSVLFGGNGLTTPTGGTAVPGSWYTPNTANVGGTYYINITKTSGLSGLAFSAAQGAWTNITTGGITISSNAWATIGGTYQISSSVTGTPVVASGTITLSGNNGVQQPTYNGTQNWILAGNGTSTLNGVAASNWYLPTTASIGTSFWVKITQTGGTSGYTFNAATGAFTNIAAGGLTIGISGPPASSFNVVGTYQIASDSGGANILGSGSVTLNGGSNVQSPNWSGTAPLVLAGNGAATLNGSATSGWYVPNASNVGSLYWIKITRTGGTSGVNFTAAQGSWTNITNSGLTINISGYTGDVGTVNAIGTYQISSSSGGTPVLGSGSITLSLAGLTVIHVYTSVVTNATETIPTGTTTVKCEVWGSGGGGGRSTGSGSLFSPGFAGGCGGLPYSVYTAAALGGVGKTLKYTITAGGAGAPGGGSSSAGSAGTIVAGTATGFTTMTGNGGGGGQNGNGSSGGTGGTATGGNTSNTTGATGSTIGVTGKITGDGGPYGAGGAPGTTGSAGGTGAAVFFYS